MRKSLNCKLQKRWFDCQRELSGKKPFIRLGQQFSCGNRKCKSRNCNKVKSYKDFQALIVSLFSFLSGFFVVLKVEKYLVPLNSENTSKLLSVFFDNLKIASKKKNLKIQYIRINEYDQNDGHPHFHFIFNVTGLEGFVIDEKFFRELLVDCWFSAVNKAGLKDLEVDLCPTVSCKNIRDKIGAAFYLTGAKTMKMDSVAPFSWNANQCKHTTASKGFYSAPPVILRQIYKRYSSYLLNKGLSDESKQKLILDEIHDLKMELKFENFEYNEEKRLRFEKKLSQSYKETDLVQLKNLRDNFFLPFFNKKKFRYVITKLSEIWPQLVYKLIVLPSVFLASAFFQIVGNLVFGVFARKLMGSNCFFGLKTGGRFQLKNLINKVKKSLLEGIQGFP